ncbi:MAG: ABC transporter permease [Lachnospiraceae bacterium]|nr:ABC transporter permease [Lachnospiraceae bacterium]
MKKIHKSRAKMSDQERYVLEHHKKHHQITALRLLILAAFLFLWEIAAKTGLIDSFFFSSPSIIAECFMELLENNTLGVHLAASIGEVLFSFALIIALSLAAAILLWWSDFLSRILEPFLVVLNSLPKSALAPLIIVWIGTGAKAIIAAGVSVALFGSIISLYSGFRETDEEKILLVRCLGGRKRDVLTKVVLPSGIPNIFSVMKVNIGLALVGVVIGEFFAGRVGLGYLIIYGTQVFQLDMVITSILLLCILAMLMYQILQWAEHRYYRKTGIENLK